MATLKPIPPIRRGAYGTYAYGTLSWSGSRAAEVVVPITITKTITLPPQVREIELPPHPNRPRPQE